MRDRFLCMGGECNYLFRVTVRACRRAFACKMLTVDCGRRAAEGANAQDEYEMASVEEAAWQTEEMRSWQPGAAPAPARGSSMLPRGPTAWLGAGAGGAALRHTDTLALLLRQIIAVLSYPARGVGRPASAWTERARDVTDAGRVTDEGRRGADTRRPQGGGSGGERDAACSS